MKARAKEALLFNLHSEKYIRMLQMSETQLKRKLLLLPFSLTSLLNDITIWA